MELNQNAEEKQLDDGIGDTLVLMADKPPCWRGRTTSFLRNFDEWNKRPTGRERSRSCALLTRTLGSQIARQSAQVIHQIPNVIGGLNFAEGRHSGVADPVLDDPKQLLILIALHAIAGEISCARILPSSRLPLRTAIVRMTDAAFQAVICSTVFNAGF